MTVTERTPISAASVWRPDDIADPTEWTIEFTEDERAEIVTATRAAASFHLQMDFQPGDVSY